MQLESVTSKFRPFARLKIASLFVALSFISLSAHASQICRALFSDSPLIEQTVEFTRFGAKHVAMTALPTNFRVMVWNVYKSDKPGLSNDFQRLSQNLDLALFQEAIDSDRFMREISTANDELAWTMAKSFFRKKSDGFTGVATGARVVPLKQQRLLSPKTEPFSKTPKTALISDYALVSADGSTQVLRVVNVHAINFVSTDTFIEHMRQVFTLIKEHQGPVILAGDFNTWNPWRTQALKDGAQHLGLKETHSSGGSFLTLDYVFTRGLRAVSIDDPGLIRSSDHQPLLLSLQPEI